MQQRNPTLSQAFRNTLTISFGVWMWLMTAVIPCLQISGLMDCHLTESNVILTVMMLWSIGTGLIIYGVICTLKDGVDNE